MRRLRAGFVVVLLGTSAACGLSVVGVGDPMIAANDASVVDADVIDATTPPLAACVDASCLALPTGWSPIAMGDGGCGSDFTATTLLANPKLAPLACTCATCTPTGAYACGNKSDIHGGDSCGDSKFETANVGMCTAGQATQHLRADGIPVMHGTEGCTAASVVGPGAETDSVTVCTPGCNADVCGTQCIIGAGDTACPAGYPKVLKAGTSVDAGCAPCDCNATPPTGNCGGAVRAYTGNNCDDSGASQTYTFDSCNTYPSQYSSVLLVPVPPAVTCSNAPSATSTPSLAGVSTICCR